MSDEQDLAIIFVWLSSMKSINHGASNERKSFGHVALEILEYDLKTRKHIRGSYAENTYISIGPEDYDSMGIGKGFCDVKMKTVETYKEDIEKPNEGRKPDLVFCFHDLEFDIMKEKVKKFKEGELDYKLFSEIKTKVSLTDRLYRKWLGSASLKCCDKSHNCASAVFALLYEGGFTNKFLFTSDVNYKASIDASNSSVDAVTERSLQKMFDAFGYLVEASTTTVAMNPDIFAEYMKQAKRNQFKTGKKHYNDIVKRLYEMDGWPSKKEDLSKEEQPIIGFGCFVAALYTIIAMFFVLIAYLIA